MDWLRRSHESPDEFNINLSVMLWSQADEMQDTYYREKFLDDTREHRKR